jgi:hypothetical protein
MGMVAGGAYDEVAERGHSFVGSCAAQVTDGCCEEGGVATYHPGDFSISFQSLFNPIEF